MAKLRNTLSRYAIPGLLVAIAVLAVLLWRIQVVRREAQATRLAQVAPRNPSPTPLPNMPQPPATPSDTPQSRTAAVGTPTSSATPPARTVSSQVSPAPTLTSTIQPSPTARPSSTATPSATNKPSPTPTYTSSPRPTATPTPTPPVLVLLADTTALARYVKPTLTLTPTPTTIPEILVGKIIFRSSLFAPNTQRPSGRFYAVDPDGSNLALLLDPWPYYVALDREWLSPDGHYRVRQVSGNQGLDLFLCSLTGQPLRQLTFLGGGKAYDPAWAPDGRQIVFASNQEGDDNIFAVTIDGQLTVKLTTKPFDWQSDKHPSYSPDGRQIVFYRNRGGREQIWIMNADGSNQRHLVAVDGNCWDPVWVKRR